MIFDVAFSVLLVLCVVLFVSCIIFGSVVWFLTRALKRAASNVRDAFQKRPDLK